MEEFESNEPQDARLWELLGRARPIEASPWFHGKVMRAIQPEAAELSAWQRMWCWLSPVAVCAVLAALVLVGTVVPEREPAAVADADFDTIAGLDLLIADYESSLWLENSLSSVSR